ncbi:hypothetical protein LP419_10740 [Massilia sp. H-1]|nr:hypothetical protein LP419_10740 [Massilia sp. H-1]
MLALLNADVPRGELKDPATLGAKPHHRAQAQGAVSGRAGLSQCAACAGQGPGAFPARGHEAGSRARRAGRRGRAAGRLRQSAAVRTG